MAGDTESRKLDGGGVVDASEAPGDPEAHLRLLEEAADLRATDVHIDPLLEGYQIRMRIDGVITPIRSIGRKQGRRLINQFTTAAGIEPGAIFSSMGVRRKFEVSRNQLDCRLTLAPCV